MLLRRTVSGLLAGMLVFSMMSVTAAASDTATGSVKEAGYTDKLTTSYDPGNYITFSLVGGTLKFEGVLTRDGLDQIMLQLQDENGNLVWRKLTLDISSGVYFSGEMELSDISQLPEKTFIEVYTSITADRSDDLWNNHGKSVLLVRTEEGHKIAVSPVLDGNSGYFDAWINPCAVFDAETPDYIKELADSICVGAESDYERVRAIYVWVVESIYYDYDYVKGIKSDTAASVSDVYTLRYALPAGFCNILEALLEAAGIPAVITQGHTTNMSELMAGTEYLYTNLAVEAYADGRWIIMLPYRETAKKFENGEYSDWIGRAYRGFDISHEFLATFFKVSSRIQAESEDVPSLWAWDEVAESIARGVVPAELQGKYSEGVTCEEFCRLILNMLAIKMSVSDTDGLFDAFGATKSEVELTDGVEAVGTAERLGVFSETEDGVLEPDRKLTRQDAAVILAGAARLLGITANGDAPEFSDISDAADFAKDSVLFVTSIVSEDGTALMGGVDGGKFGPVEGYTREQAFVTVLRLYKCS